MTNSTTTECQRAMTDGDLRSIQQAPDLMLAEWWCLLNEFDWPSEGLGEPEPAEYVSGSRRGQIMAAIVERIGMRACLREANAVRHWVSLESLGADGAWTLTSRSHSREQAFREFKQDAAAIAAAGFGVRGFSISDVRP